jgi:hypothetical protein
MMSPGTLRRKKPERTVSSNSEMSHSTRQDDDGNDGLCSLLPQLARQSSLILHGGAPNSPVVSNAEYSEQLCSLRSSVMKRSIRRNSKTIHESGTAAIATATRNLPDGLSSFAIHSDLYLAPHKLQHAIYEARRQAQLFNDTLLRKEPMLTAKKDEAPVSIDARASAHMSTYTNMWTRNEAIPRQYKDAEHIALNLLTQMTGNENGTGFFFLPSPLIILHFVMEVRAIVLFCLECFSSASIPGRAAADPGETRKHGMHQRASARY